MTRRSLRAALADGSLERIRPGAYLPTAPGQSRWQQRERRLLGRIAAVHRQFRSELVISHTSAALLHGLWVADIDEDVHVTQEMKSPGRRSLGVHRHHDALPADDITVVDGIRVTSIERTVIDCARSRHPREGLVIADSGMRALLRPNRFEPEQFTAATDQLRAELRDRLESGPPRGRRRARVVLEYADPLSESAPESMLRWIALAHGLPRPTVQMPVRTRLGTYYADMGWEVEVRQADGTVTIWLVLLEYDGVVKYVPVDAADPSSEARAASDVVVAEKRREDAIRERPHTAMRRFEWADLADVYQAFERIRAAFPAGALPPLEPRADLLGLYS